MEFTLRMIYAPIFHFVRSNFHFGRKKLVGSEDNMKFPGPNIRKIPRLETTLTRAINAFRYKGWARNIRATMLDKSSSNIVIF